MEKEISITCTRQAADYLKRLSRLHQEEGWCLYLNAHDRLIKAKMLFRGGIESVPVDQRIVFGEALRCYATKFYFLHNHPSGCVVPSGKDIETTVKLKSIGRTMDIPLIDHIIIGDGRFFSIEQGKEYEY